MRIGVVSDIHGNDEALERVLEAAVALGVEQLLVLGDVVGYYYRPDRVMELLEAWTPLMIRGNHEELLAEARRDSSALQRITSKYGSGHAAALEVLSPAAIGRLESLPDRCSVNLGGMSIVMCHGAPFDSDAYVYPNAANEILDRCAMKGVDFVLMGHTHHAFAAVRDTVVLINAGSVGQSRDVGGVASWVMLDTDNRSFVFHRVRYATARLAREAARRDPDHPYLQEVLLRSAGRRRSA